jgi:hypothetical protein
LRKHEKCKQHVLDFIGGHEPCSKEDVINFMKSDSVPKEYRTWRVQTRNLIKELEEADRVKVQNKNGWESGQAQFLILNNKNRYDWLNGQIENIEQMFSKEHPEYSRKGVDLLLFTLGRDHKFINNENDRYVLTEKIINAMMRIRYKKDDKDLLSDLWIPY